MRFLKTFWPVLAGLLLLLVAYLLLQNNPKKDAASAGSQVSGQYIAPGKAAADKPQAPAGDNAGLVDGQTVTPLNTSLEDLHKASLRGSGELVHAIARVLQSRQDEAWEGLQKSGVIPQAQYEALAKLIRERGMKLHGDAPVVEVGELERLRKFRWALNLADGSRIVFDLLRGADGKWSVAETFISQAGKSKPGEPNLQADVPDALGIVDVFLRACIAQEFALAKQHVDGSKVADASLAGLCILFEDGAYSLRANKPLRHMFETDKSAGFIANVLSRENKQAGNVGITLLKNAEQQWKVSEIALDSLLQDFAQRFADGDEFYCPLVKNPKGGDSLVLYFGFNEALLSPRSQRQLRIVAELLKLDANKKIKISGHTDDVGGEEYNQKLSEARAEAVRDALITAGLDKQQIIVEGFGKRQPRRQPLINAKTPAPLDNEQIRRANRRAEIYLDF